MIDVPNNPHEVELDGTLLTSIFTIRNGIIGGYFFAEAILSMIPFSDQVLLNDGGSSDGTLEALNKLKDLFPDKIKIYTVPDREKESWLSIDNGLNRMIRDVKSTWIFEIQGDEILEPNAAKEAINVLKRSPCFNSIRHSRLDYQACGEEILYDMRTVRFVRNIPNLTSCTGGDNFQLGRSVLPRPGFSLHNVPPEREAFSFHLKHYLEVFPKNIIEKARRHAQDLAVNARDRIDIYEQEKTANRSVFCSKPQSHVPAIIHGLCGEEKYSIRDEIFDKDWLTKTTEVDYTCF